MDVSHIRTVARQYLPEAIAFLRSLVEVNSHTANTAGIEENSRLIEERFRDFGWEAERVACSESAYGRHLLLDSGGDGPAYFLVSHLDTVYPAEEQVEGWAGWQENKGLVVGPGVFDIKGGTAMVWLCLKVLADVAPDLFARTHWVAGWNSCEEVLARDFVSACIDRYPGPRVALVFEGDNRDRGDFELVDSRSGMTKFRLSATGRGAHAGNGHEKGINAITGLCAAALEVAALTDYARNTTVNIGMIRGGVATNRVPDSAEASLEVRFTDPAHLCEIRTRLKAIAAQPMAGCAIEITELGEAIPPMLPSDSTVFQCWQTAAESLGVQIGRAGRRGLSDGNHFSAHTRVMDGLGPQGGNAHGVERVQGAARITEFLHLDTFAEKTVLDVIALAALLGRDAD